MYKRNKKERERERRNDNKTKHLRCDESTSRHSKKERKPGQEQRQTAPNKDPTTAKGRHAGECKRDDDDEATKRDKATRIGSFDAVDDEA